MQLNYIIWYNMQFKYIIWYNMQVHKITLWSGHAIYSNRVLTWHENIKPVCPIYICVQTGNLLICVPLFLCRGFCPTSRPSPTWGASTRCGCSWWWAGWCLSWASPAASALCGRTPSCSSLYVGSLQVSARHVITHVTDETLKSQKQILRGRMSCGTCVAYRMYLLGFGATVYP